MEILELVVSIFTFCVNLCTLVYQVLKDKKQAAATDDSDGSVTK